MVVWRGLTNSWVKKRSKRQRRKWKIHPSESVSSGPQLCLTLQYHGLQHTITNSQRLLKPMSIELVRPSNHLILCHPFFLLPLIFPSITVFFNESVLCIMWPKYWSFSLSISSSNEYSGLIFYRMDCLDLLAVQGTLKSLHQHHSSKALILWCSAFFIVQLSHPYTTHWKNHSLD